MKTGYMRLAGIVLLLAAGVDAVTLNSNRPSASVCPGHRADERQSRPARHPGWVRPGDLHDRARTGVRRVDLIVVAGLFGDTRRAARELLQDDQAHAGRSAPSALAARAPRPLVRLLLERGDVSRA